MGKGKDKQPRKRRTAEQISRDKANASAASKQQAPSARLTFANSGFAVPRSSSGKTAVESTTVVSVKSKPAVAPATAEPNTVAPVVATQAAAAAPPLKAVPLRTGRGSGIDKPPPRSKIASMNRPLIFRPGPE